MSQDNPQISTTPPLPGLQLVQDLNKALQTLGTDFAGPDDPAAMAWPYSTWADTGTGTLKRRNAANSAWMIERNLFEDLRRTASATDTTAGRVLKVGDFGVGGNAPLLAAGTDLGAVLTPGFYTLAGSYSNDPLGTGTATGVLQVIHRAYSATGCIQIAYLGSLGYWIRQFSDGTPSAWVELYHSGNLSSDLQWLGTPIGGYITPYSPPPTNDPRFRYVLCTAGEDGSGDYNEGVLINESVSGSAPLIVATAEVSLAGSPMNGQTIHLINTEERFIGAGAAEAFEDDSFQGHTFGASAIPGSYLAYNAGRTGSDAVSGAGTVMYNATGGAYTSRMLIAADQTNGTPRTSDHTQPSTHRLIHYRRIK